jgi:hypothetical protein
VTDPSCEIRIRDVIYAIVCTQRDGQHQTQGVSCSFVLEGHDAVSSRALGAERIHIDPVLRCIIHALFNDAVSCKEYI